MILGTVLIVFTTIINAVGVKLMAQINSAGVAIELVAAVLLILALAVNITRGPDVVTETQDRGADWELGYLGAFLAASLASTYVMYGFDTASSLGEESVNPRKNAPRAILRALIASFIIGGLILLLAMMAVTDITAADISTGGLQYIILDVLGNTIGDLFLWCVVIAITVCCLAVHTAAIRMMFAMARDNNLPAGEHLAKIDPRTKTPIIPAVLIGAIAILILLVNIRQPQIFVVVTSIGIILIYIAYLLVTGPMLLARIRGHVAARGHARGLLHDGQEGLRGEPRGGRLGRRDRHQPRLAALVDLQRHRAVPLVPQVGRDAVRARRRASAASPTTGSCSATRPARSPRTRTSPRSRSPRRRRPSPAEPSRPLDEVAAFLRRHPPFDSLEERGVAAVAAAAVERAPRGRAPRSSTARWPTSDSAYVVRSGAVELLGDGRLLDVAGPGRAVRLRLDARRGAARLRRARGGGRRSSTASRRRHPARAGAAGRRCRSWRARSASRCSPPPPRRRRPPPTAGSPS